MVTKEQKRKIREACLKFKRAVEADGSKLKAGRGKDGVLQLTITSKEGRDGNV